MTMTSALEQSTLEQLKTMTDLVADTGDIEAIKQYQPMDATTNPSLLYKAAQLPQYEPVMQQAIDWAQQQSNLTDQQVTLAMDRFSVLIGCEILNYIPGRISTEVDARLSFNTQATIDKAKTLIAYYDQLGIASDRVLIKIAATWEGIQAARALEKVGIQCNLTLLFSLTQAVACADANVFLISPFVGRILDWYKKNTGRDEYSSDEDPGVESVTEIYHYYKQHNISTIIMGASFRNCGEILALAGCDRLTISPQLLSELMLMTTKVTPRLSENTAGVTPMKPVPTKPIELTEVLFRYQLNDNAMATEKLAEGIRNFVKDQQKLEAVMLAKIHSHQ